MHQAGSGPGGWRPEPCWPGPSAASPPMAPATSSALSSNQLLSSGALAPDHPLQGVTVQGGSTEGSPRDRKGERQVREGPAAGSDPS